MALREPTLFTLAALRDGPLHGYAVAARARQLSGGRVELTAGTLYGALDRLVASGMVEVDREEVVEGRRRRYHRLTDEGARAVQEELEHLRSTVAALDGAGTATPEPSSKNTPAPSPAADPTPATAPKRARSGGRKGFGAPGLGNALIGRLATWA